MVSSALYRPTFKGSEGPFRFFVLRARQTTRSRAPAPHRPTGEGSDIHVMLALRRRSRQVVVTNKQFNGPDMVGELLGKGQRGADQPGHALPQRVVEPFEVIGFPRQLAD